VAVVGLFVVVVVTGLLVFVVVVVLGGVGRGPASFVLASATAQGW